jgi:acetoacetyl-CoA synthetase
MVGKPIVHGHGGVLLEHLKSLGLQLGLGPKDRFFWHTTTGWMMWNYLVSGLVVGCSIVLFDGDPGYPDQLALWRMAAAEHLTVFGVSPRFLLMNERAGVRPADLGLSALVTVGSTWSPLGTEAYDWFAREVGHHIALVSASGGTDILSGLACGAPIVPVYAGEISCAALGVDLDVVDSHGNSVLGEPGELVVRAPMPSMPIAFWNDPDRTRLRDAYFAANPGLWTHGDWAVATTRGSFVVSGRSDATLNRGGVRIGTAELYSAIEQHPLVDDSLAVCVEGATNDDDLLVVFVSLAGDRPLDDVLEAELKREIRHALSPGTFPTGSSPSTSFPGPHQARRRRCRSSASCKDALRRLRPMRLSSSARQRCTSCARRLPSCAEAQLGTRSGPAISAGDHGRWIPAVTSWVVPVTYRASSETR